jgi:hypothetical protein
MADQEIIDAVKFGDAGLVSQLLNARASCSVTNQVHPLVKSL